MAAFTLVSLAQWLQEQGQEECDAGKGTVTPQKVGRPQAVSPALENRLVQRVDGRKRAIDRRLVDCDRRYGDRCTDADAIRSLMRDMYRERLIKGGLPPATAQRCVEEFATSPTFTQRFNSHKVRLSRYRRGAHRKTPS
jgi:hypothetical protein